MPEKEYSYPINVDWTTEEVIDVVQFYEAVEAGYTNGVKVSELEDKYNKFKKVVPSKSEEKTMFKTFEKSSGYAPFQLIKQIKEHGEDEKIFG